MQKECVCLTPRDKVSTGDLKGTMSQVIMLGWAVMDTDRALRASWRKGPGTGVQGERGSKGSWYLCLNLSMLTCSRFAPLGWTLKSRQANVLPTDKPAGHRPKELAWSQVSLTSEPRHTQGASKEADMRTPYPEPCPALSHPARSPTLSLFQFPRALHCPGLFPAPRLPIPETLGR